MLNILDQDVMYLPGVGPKKKEILSKELGIQTWRDLLEHYPYKYVDRSRIYRISEISGDMPFVQIRGRMLGYDEYAMGARKKRIVGHFSDGHGVVDLVWFQGAQYIYKNYPIGKELIVFGRPTVYGGRYQFAHPDIDDASQLQLSDMGMQPYYMTTERMKKAGINSRAMEKMTKTLVTKLPETLPETLPPYITGPLHLISRLEALRQIHYPHNAREMQQARYRLKFEELFYVQLNILRYASDHRRKYRGYIFSRAGAQLNDFYRNHLPFDLTNAQKRVVREIRDDMASGRQMNRLLQGDVGSGKTMVAVLSALLAVGNGAQACIMAPTEVLARQHYLNISRYLAPTGVACSLLIGSTTKAERKPILKGLEDGSIGIIIGTHALIEDPVIFRNLGLAVIDEQHRFGVEQRSRLWAKGRDGIPPHVLVMTATPIPRTLAMTLYGDLDVSVIDEMPPGRKPVKTILIGEGKKPVLYNFMKNQIAKGRQVFIVYPLIFESEKMDYRNLEAGYEEIVTRFPLPQYKVAIVHGQQTSEVKKLNMDAFAAGRADILVSTTVIEVGVDVPNATVIVIESAERFGLAQLHQLRGRVGRGSDESFCVLVHGNKVSKESQKRLELMCATENGFDLAEEDLKMRGPGDLEGTQQSGLPIDLKIASLSHDGQILSDARLYAEHILSADPTLSATENAPLLNELRKDKYIIRDFSVIS